MNEAEFKEEVYYKYAYKMLEKKYYIYQNILGLIGVLIFFYLAYHWVEINEYISPLVGKLSILQIDTHQAIVALAMYKTLFTLIIIFLPLFITTFIQNKIKNKIDKLNKQGNE